MFRRRPAQQKAEEAKTIPSAERITSVLGKGVTWKGELAGTGGVRIEGVLEGDVALRGLLVVGESGRVESKHVRAHVIVVAGAVRGDITTEKLEIRSTGRVWGDVTTAAFATEEGAFLRGQITMLDEVDLDLAPADEAIEAENPEG